MGSVRAFFSIIFFIVLSIQYISAQNLTFKHYGLEEGLPQETIYCIEKDSKGFFWFGTADGVVRFDGHQFVTPQPDLNSKIDVSGYRIEALLAKNNLIYIGTTQNGVVAFNTENETLTQILDADAQCSSIISKNELVLVTYHNKGVAVVSGTKAKYLSFNINIPKQIVSAAFYHNFVYIATKEGAIFKFDLKNIDKNTIDLQEVTMAPSQITKLKVIDNSLLVCTTNNIFRLNANKKEVNEIKLLYQGKTDLTYHFNTLESAYGIYYLASNNGLFTAKLNGDKFEVVKHYEANHRNDQNTVSFNNTNDLYIDDDILLIGNFNLEIASIKKSKVFENPTRRYPIDDPSTFGVIDTDRFLFTATSSGLVIEDNTNPSNYKVFPEYRCRGFVIDKHQNIWAASGHGLVIVNSETFQLESPKFTEIQTNTPNSNLPSNNIRSVYKDHHNIIWFVTYNDEFGKFTGNLDMQNYQFKTFSTDVFPSQFTIAMLQDSFGTYWMTTQKGLSAFKIEDDTFSLIKNYDETDGLITKGVLSIFEDKDKTLWIATRKGLCKYLRDTNTFTSYAKRQGLSNTFVYNIEEDNHDNLWLSTNGGLFRFHKPSETFSNYNPKDGVQSTEFNLGAVYKNEITGYLFFGGINGLNKFDPSKINELDKEGNLSFTNLKIKDTIITPETASVINGSITTTKKINANYDDFPINLSFSGLDFRPNSNITYTYKLLPDDENWNDLGYKNNIQLLTLAPKRYTLQVQGKSRTNLWGSPPLEMVINVKPPWYQSTLAYSLYLLVFLTLVYLFYRISLQRQIAGQESKRLKDLDELKSRFITNITHEFRTPLTIILGYLDTLKTQFSNKSEIGKSLETVEKNSKSLLNLVNEMLDLAKLEHGELTLNNTQDDVIAYLKYIKNSFIGVAENKNIKLKLHADLDELFMDFDTEKVRQVFTNLLSNALKFSPKDTEVSIHIKTNNNLLQVSVQDQGVGIPETHLPYIFDRFYQVESVGQEIVQGTGIGLALTKELITLMGGTIQVFSKMNEGTRFLVELPITNNALKATFSESEIYASIGETFVPKNDDVIVVDDTNSILIVEDNTDMARYIASCLQPKYKVQFAKNGQEGLEKAQEQVPDLIITDVMMPVMNGFELTKQLQERISTNHIPIIMLTSKAMKEDVLQGVLSGIDTYLTKPFQKEELLLRIQMLIKKREALQHKYKTNDLRHTPNLSTSDKNEHFLNDVIKVIHEHIDDSGFNSNQLAKSLGMSDSQLYRKLKAVSNSSTAIFIRRVRLEKSKELLMNPELSISEVAYATGFNDPNWYSKAFKEAFEISPTSYRN